MFRYVFKNTSSQISLQRSEKANPMMKPKRNTKNNMRA